MRRSNSLRIIVSLSISLPWLPAAGETFASSEQGQQVEIALRKYFDKPQSTPESLRGLSRFDTLMRDNAKAIRTLAWEAYRAGRFRRELQKDFEASRVTSGKYLSPYVVRKVGKKPEAGWPLFIAMHGGGNAPKALNDQQWKVMERYYRDHAESGGYLYLALRAPTDEWNGFYTGYVYPLIAKLIRQFLLFEEVNPNKTFIMGYSHGGYGAFAIGPKMADRFAAIHSSAAAPTDRESSPKNLRNTPFTFMIGDRDTAYGRLKRCIAFDKEIRQLRVRQDIYPARMFLMRGHGHVGLPDRDQIKSMYPAVRNPVPKTLVWEPTDSVVTRFAWLEIPNPSKKQLVEASCRDNRIEIKLTKVEALNLYLDERLVDFGKPVIVRVNGTEVVNRSLSPSISSLCRTLEERGDPELTFSVKGPLPLGNSPR
jgi:predicted esterase